MVKNKDVLFILLRYTVAFFLLFFVTTIWADVAVPTLSHRVTDLTATLNAEQSTALENKLAAFEAKKGSQIAVLILPSTQPETIEAFGIRLADSWKVGRKNIDDGVILIIAKDDHRLRLEIGRGLESAIPNAIAQRVIDEIISPKFKQNDFVGGIDAGVSQVMQLIDGEPLPVISSQANDVLGFLIFFLWLILFFGIGGVVIFSFSTMLERLIGYSSWHSGNNNSSWSGRSSGSWSGGGGSFGGGGASGSW